MKSIKHLYTLLLILSCLAGLLGQTNKKTLNYQAVILDPKAIDIPGASIVGQPLNKGNVCLRFSLINAQGGLDYEETQQVTTDEYGLVNVAIGAGAQAQSGNSTSIYKSFESVVWNSSVKSLKVSVSYDGCSSFKQVSSQAFNYTPYALYAESVDYKNVREAPTKLSQFTNDPGYIIPKDLDPLKADIKSNTADIKTNTSQIAMANQAIADNKKSSDAAFLIVNQSITSLDTQVAANTTAINANTSSINTINSKLTDQQNQITATNNNLNTQIGGLQGQLNTTNSTVSNLTGTAEVVSNKSTETNLGGASPSDQLYPSQKAAKSYIDNAIYDAVGSGVPDATTLAAGKVKLAGDLGGTAMNPTVPALAGKENSSNKTTAIDLGAGNPSDQLYPSQKATKAYVDNSIYAAVGTGVPDATTNAAGKVKLAGDLAGTAALPTVPGLLLKADIVSPTFTGTPKAPTPALGDNSTQIATTAFVQDKINAATVNDATSSAKGILQLAGDLDGLATSPSVVKLRGTSISSVAPAAGHVLTYDATGSGVAYWAAPANSANTISGVVPVANGGTGLSSVTSGGAVYATSSNVLATGTLPFTAGGTGAISQQAAINALTGTQSARKYLRSNGTDATLSTIEALDVPTLNQNTTGNAATATSATSFTGNLSGDVTGTQSSTVVGKINGTSLAGLSTGILKNTTSTGVPTIAVAGTDYQLPITITTTGTGAATLSGTTLNIPSIATTVNSSSISGTVAVANGGTGVTTSTGSGNVVLSTSPTLVTPNLGTPSSGVATNLTGLPLTTGVTGTLPIVNGGTGTTTAPTQGGIIYATSNSAFASTAAGTTGQVLTSNGTSAPTWGSSLASLGTQTKNTVLAGPSSNLVTLVTYDGSSTSGFTIGSGVTIDNTIGNPGSSFKNAGQNYMYKDFGQNFKNKIIEFDIRLAANSTGGFVIGNQSNGSNGAGLRISSGTNNNNGFRNNDTWSYPPIGFNTLTIAADTWHSVKIVTDNGTQGGTTWYLDGTYVGNSGTHILGNGTYFGFTSDYSQTLVYFDNITIKDNSGLGATPSFRALVADDIPTLNQSTTGNAATATSATSFTGNLSGDVTGTQSSTVVGKINGTSLAGLSTGILKNTTSTGVPTIAVAGTDYQLPITITTTGTGAATLSGTTLNIPTVASAVNASTISGTLAVANGGTGVTTLTGLVKGNGTSVMTAAVAGTDYVAPSGTFYVGTTQIAHNRSSAAQTLTGVSIDGNAATATTASSAGYATTANSANSASSATTALNFTGSLVGDVSGTQGATVIGTGKVTNTMLYGGITVAKGGTGASTLTGYVKGNGTNAMTASSTIPVSDVTGAAPLASPTFTGTVTAPLYTSTPQTLTDGATISWDPSLGLNASVTLGGDRTLSFASTPPSGSYGTLVITQDATGGRGITLPSTANKILGSTSTTTIALSSTGGAKDILNFYYDGTNCFWSIGQGYGLASSSSSTNLATGVTGTLPVANGGTGLTTTPSNGQIDIGNGTGFTRTTLTAGSGISITNAAGSVTIASSGGSGVPYTGATSAVDLGAYDLTVNGLTIGKGKNNNNTNTAVGYNVIAGANYAGGGNRNTAVGSLAGQYLKDGADNSAFGYKALSGTGTPNQLYGNYNTAIGSYALSNIGENISFNTAVGSNALPSTTSGIRNTSIGYNSGTSNTTANDNTFLGANTAVSTNTLTNVTAIGSGATVSSSNTIKLGNANVTSVTTSGALTTGAVTYPIAHGTANQILTTTGSGTLTWTTPSTTATSYSGTLPVANGGTGVTSSTGTGNVVLSASPTLTGTPIAPTATAGDNSTQIATTAFVTAAVASSSGGSGNITYTTGLNNDLGGYVFYVTPNGKHGLVAETIDFSSQLYLANDYLKDPTYHSVAGKNFMDWRVPTQYELDLMFTKKVVLGLSNSDVYWSSTNIPASPGDLGSYYCRYSGGGFPDPFESEHFIRAVRSF